MKRISIISALLLAVLMAGHAAAAAPCETQMPELPPQAETASAVSAALNSKSNFFIVIPPFYLYSLIIKSAGHGV